MRSTPAWTRWRRQSATGIYVQETDAIAIDTVTVSVDRANFKSTTTALPQTLEDLVTTGVGPIKLVSTGGSITVNGGADTLGISSASTGDVLLEARDTDHDVVLNASVSVGGAGNVTLDADDDVLLNAAVTISTVGGDVVLLAGNDSGSGGVTMAGTSLVSSGDGNVRVEAKSGGDILLSSIDAGVGSVVLLAGGNITDNNGTTLNVQALGLLLVAGGKIGDAGAALDADGDNRNAIDTSVDTLAAQVRRGSTSRKPTPSPSIR